MSGAQKKLVPFSLRDTPALIERLMPVQRLSAEVFRERKAATGQTLTPLGAYWKGRKPLILNRACILASLMPATSDSAKDLEILELLLAMDEVSLGIRLNIKDGQKLPQGSYRELVAKAKRPEELDERLYNHIWTRVNEHLGTTAFSFPELVNQLGILRYGHTPKVADTFAGSGQIPFEAARLGCDVFASDLNPVACMLTWGGLSVVGGGENKCRSVTERQRELVQRVLEEVDSLGIETDGNGWRAKAHLYCLEVTCPSTGWRVPLLPSLILSYGKRAILQLEPIPVMRMYNIRVVVGAADEQIKAASVGTLRSEGKGQEPYLCHEIDGHRYTSKISTIRGDYRAPDGSFRNKLRQWEANDFEPRPDDIFQERLYAIQWMRARGKLFDYEFREVREEDLNRERVVSDYVQKNIVSWQQLGWIPDMRIEPGAKTDEPIRTRGWTHWHHLFPARHILLIALIRKHGGSAEDLLMLSRVLNYMSKLCIWSTSKPGSSKAGEGGRTGGGSDNPVNVFYNQALNTVYNYGCRAAAPILQMFNLEFKQSHCAGRWRVRCQPADEIAEQYDIFLTDPPYGDAVKYEEILEFFIAWLRKNPPAEFSEWTWDSRRALAIKGEDEDFRRGMVAAYKRMAECMPDNGMQIIMFTHQSGSIWADMANIVWASGLHVTAAWYVVTETDSPLREGSYVKGTVLLVLRKRTGELRTTRDDLAWDIKDEVERQVATLTGLNQQTKARYRDENLFADADIQMAGYAAALRVLTQYSVIDGREMAAESIRPRVKGQKTFVDELIEFAVGVANQTLVPSGIERSHWEKFKPAERFYLKLIELESQGAKTLDNYQNFAKAFKVADFKPLMALSKANAARLKSAVELGKQEMSDGAELGNTALRGVLYAIMELAKGDDGNDVLTHLSFNVEGYFDPEVREVLSELADYLANKLVELRPEEASAARVLRELIRNQRL
jgi:putative DNA methylase